MFREKKHLFADTRDLFQKKNLLPNTVLVGKIVSVLVCFRILTICTQKRPVYTQKRHIRSQKRPMHIQKRPIYTQKRPINTQKRRINTQNQHFEGGTTLLVV